MSIIISAACILVSLLGVLLFDSSAVTGILVCVLGLSAIVLSLILRKAAKAKRPLGLIPCAFMCAALLLTCFVGTHSTYATVAAELEKADKLLAREDAREALTLLNTLQEQYGNAPEILLRNAAANDMLGDENHSQAALSRLASSNAYAYFAAKAAQEIRSGDTGAALATYSQAAATYPTVPEAQLNAGYLSFVRGAYARAEFYLLHARALAPEDPLPLFFLGSVKFAQGDYAQARVYLQDTAAMKIDDAMKQDISDLLASMPEKGA